MYTILFPTDFSANSLHAIRYGINLFEGTDVQYLLVNAYTVPSSGANMSAMMEEKMRDISQKDLASFCEKIREKGGNAADFKPKCISPYGDLPEALMPTILRHKVDYIIMGSSGAGSNSATLFGSAAYATMKNAQCPVITIPLQTSIKMPARVGLATEEKLAGDEKLLEPLQKLIGQMNAWLMGIRVHKDAQPSKKVLTKEEFYKDISDIEYFDIQAHDALVGIEQAVGAHDIDMLAIIIKKRSFFDQLFHSSISKKIAQSIALPILTLHDESLKD